jgi:hypothetical protein
LNERIPKESGINEELEQIQLSSSQENDRNSRMRGKLPEGLKPRQYSIVLRAENPSPMVHLGKIRVCGLSAGIFVREMAEAGPEAIKK